MRHLTVFVLWMFVFASALIPVYSQQTVIPAGSPITVRLRDPIKTQLAKKGHRVLTDIEEPSLLPPGTLIVGEIAEARRSGRVWGRARLKLRLDTLQLPNGQKVKIKAALHRIGNLQVDEDEIEAPAGHGRDVKTVIGYTALGAGLGAGGNAAIHKDDTRPEIIAAARAGGARGAGAGAGLGLLLVLVRRGQELELEAGTELVLILREDIRF